MKIEFKENYEILQNVINNYSQHEREKIEDDIKRQKRIQQAFKLCLLIECVCVVTLIILFPNIDDTFTKNIFICISIFSTLIFISGTLLLRKFEETFTYNTITIKERLQSNINSKFGIPQTVLKAVKSEELLKIKFANKENRNDTLFCDVTYTVANKDDIVVNITHSGYIVKSSINAQEYKDTIKISLLDKRITYYYGDKLPDEYSFIL